jgi:REP element-mobilizing transposase RayT
MSSPPPLEHNTYYHIFNQGNNRENLFKEERNYPYFLKLYVHHIEPVADTFAYCLLPNHFHLLVRVKSADEIEAETKTLKVSETFRVLSPSQPFSNLFNAYTKAINKTYQRTGSLFEHPFGRIPITSEQYLTQLVTYIHQNPQRHGLIDDFRRWPYSSYRTLFSEKPTQLKREIVLKWFGSQQQVEQLHQQKVSAGALAPLLLEDFD